MKTLTFEIADRLDELAGEWSKHTPQCEALMMAAKEVMTFEQEEKERMIDFAQEVFRNRYNQIHQSLGSIADDIYNETFNNNEK
jgi:hypothetical protein